MALNKEEYNALSNEEKTNKINEVITRYKDAGADFVIMNMSELIELVDSI